VFGEFERFRQRAVGRQAFFKSLSDWLQECLFPTKPLVGSELGIARHHSIILESWLKEAEQGLLSRHEADEQWAHGTVILDFADAADFPQTRRYSIFARSYRRPVHCAPFVAAQINLTGVICPEKLLFELRQLREFDRDWFDTAFAIALCLGLAQWNSHSGT
jgi:hypothetical protein